MAQSKMCHLNEKFELNQGQNTTNVHYTAIVQKSYEICTRLAIRRTTIGRRFSNL